jgi:5-methyltetrahydropteroyltriglutamate--homocysteine methyltransferase
VKRSTSRILTTHTGSLPRPSALIDLLIRRDAGEAVDDEEFQTQVREAVSATVGKQADARIDVANDGEMGKQSYSTYVKDRLTGFEGEVRPFPRQSSASQEFPEWAERRFTSQSARPLAFRRPACNGPITLKDPEAVALDVANLKQTTQGAGFEEVFMSAASPGVVAVFLPNEYYRTHEEYVHAIGAAMRHEYRAIVEAGFLLQVDCPDLALGRDWSQSDEEFVARNDQNVEALNEALAGIPSERVRIHLCWGNYEGPHTHDVPLSDIWPTVTRAHANGISYEGANPRHEHEWVMFEDVKLGPDTVVIPGVLDSTTNFVEHPELVAQRITRLAKLVGPEHVIAGTDCGFGTFAGSNTVDGRIAFAKLAAMAEGALIASRQLFN